MKNKILLTIFSIILLIPAAIAQEKEKGKLQLVIPKATWEPIFFDHINKGAKAAGLPDLRKFVLPGDDLEIRIWIDFGLSELEGFIIRRTNDKWLAFHIKGIDPRLSRKNPLITFLTPKSGWDIFWHHLTDEGVLTLPDASELKDEAVMIKDGVSYVIEINMNKIYRTYHYSNPEYQKWKEAKHIIKIEGILLEEFNLKRLGI